MVLGDFHPPPRRNNLARHNEATGAIEYYHADGLGSIVATSDSAGVLTGTIRYDAWGNIETGSPAPFAFTGREWDAGTGLYYYRARYYDAKIGRFISEDPIGFAGGVNSYGYVKNNTPNMTDAHGLQSADLRNEWSVTGTKPSPPGRGPDYYALGIGGPVKGVIGGGVVVTVDRYGRLYFSVTGGAGVGFPGVMKLYCGTLTQGKTPTREELDAFVGGGSWSIEGYVGVGGGYSWSGDRNAIELGLGTPQLGVGPSGTWLVSQVSNLRSQPRK